LPAREDSPREELAVFVFIEPRALDVEQLEAGDKTRQRERVDRELRDRPVGAGIRLVVDNMDGAVADLKKVDVSGDAGIGRCPGIRGTSLRPRVCATEELPYILLQTRDEARTHSGLTISRDDESVLVRFDIVLQDRSL
jgi:hypothetical protein